jgi:protein-disulfide isomerase
MELSLDNKKRALGILLLILFIAAGGLFVYYQQPVAPPRGSADAPGTDAMPQVSLREHELGSKDAPVTIIEYASLTCPHCAYFNEKVFPELKTRYIDTGKVRYIFREFPRDELDLFAFMLTNCAAEDKFFPFVDVLFKQQDKWVVSNPLPILKGIAKQVGFTDESFDACSKNKPVQDAIIASGEQGSKAGVKGTPTIFINGKVYMGGPSIEELEKSITPLLKS